LVDAVKDADPKLRLELCRVLIDVGAPELDKALPALIGMLKPERVEDVEDEEASKGREAVRQLVVRAGKPAGKHLLAAADRGFGGGTPRTAAGILKGAARLEVVLALHAIGPKGRTPESLRVLAALERSDPFPAVRAATRKARVRIQEKE